MPLSNVRLLGLALASFAALCFPSPPAAAAVPQSSTEVTQTKLALERDLTEKLSQVAPVFLDSREFVITTDLSLAPDSQVKKTSVRILVSDDISVDRIEHLRSYLLDSIPISALRGDILEISRIHFPRSPGDKVRRALLDGRVQLAISLLVVFCIGFYLVAIPGRRSR